MSPANRTTQTRTPSHSGRPCSASLSEPVSALRAFPGSPEKLLMHTIVPLGPGHGKALGCLGSLQVRPALERPTPRVRIHCQRVDDVGPALAVLIAVAHRIRQQAMGG